MSPETFDLSGEALFRDDLLRGLGADHQNAANSAQRCIVVDWAIAVGPIDIFATAVTCDRDEVIFMPRRSPARHHLFDLGTDDVPYLAPDLARGPSQGSWVPFWANRPTIRVVV